MVLVGDCLRAEQAMSYYRSISSCTAKASLSMAAVNSLKNWVNLCFLRLKWVYKDIVIKIIFILISHIHENHC